MIPNFRSWPSTAMPSGPDDVRLGEQSSSASKAKQYRLLTIADFTPDLTGGSGASGKTMTPDAQAYCARSEISRCYPWTNVQPAHRQDYRRGNGGADPDDWPGNRAGRCDRNAMGQERTS
jgi:hypothetical protein